MGTYSLVPKKKTKVLKQRTMLEMFKQLQKIPQVWVHVARLFLCFEHFIIYMFVGVQVKEVANVNGEKVGNGSEEEESEDVESEEEERRQQQTEESPSAVVQEIPGSMNQVVYG